MLITLIVVMISQVYAYVQTHQNVYIKCNFLYIKYTRIKLEAGEGVGEEWIHVYVWLSLFAVYLKL